MSKQRKSVGRRRSRSLAGFASKDLCEEIPKSLSPSDRLLMLLQRAFHNALSVVQKEFLLKEDFDISTFKQKEKECWEKLKSAIEEKKLDESAVAKNGLQCESFLKGKVEECNETIAVLEAESKKWSDQILYYREALKKEIDSSYSINSSEWKEEDQLYNYSDVMKETSATEEKLHQQIEALSSTKVILKDCVNLNKSSDSNLCKKCTKYYEQKITETPRRLIKKMVFARKHIKPYSKFK